MTQKNHKHKCPLCKALYRCETTFDHSGEMSGEPITCEGDFNSPCNNHSIDDIAKYCIEQGLIDDLPLTPENYGEQNYQALVNGLKPNSTWL